MSKEYTYEFNDYQNNRFAFIENKDIRASLMSVLAYLILYNEKRNEDYKKTGLKILEKQIDKLRVSFSILHKKYARNRKYRGKKVITLATLKDRIYTLVELGLLKIEKDRDVNLYSFIDCEETKISENLSGFLTSEKVPEVIENTTVNDNDEKTLYNSVRDNKDLDSNSCKNNMDYEGYIDAERKVNDWSFVCKKLNELFKAFKVRSNWIKEQVISKLNKYYHTITIKHLESYICTCISNAQQQSYSKYQDIIKIQNCIPAAPVICNFEEREMYSDPIAMARLERTLLGWNK